MTIFYIFKRNAIPSSAAQCFSPLRANANNLRLEKKVTVQDPPCVSAANRARIETAG